VYRQPVGAIGSNKYPQGDSRRPGLAGMWRNFGDFWACGKFVHDAAWTVFQRRAGTPTINLTAEALARFGLQVYAFRVPNPRPANSDASDLAVSAKVRQTCKPEPASQLGLRNLVYYFVARGQKSAQPVGGA
jgi:hypothetical protein